VSPLLAALPTDVPVHVGRDEARAAAVRELLAPIYHRDEPTIYDRARTWLGKELARLIQFAVAVTPGGPWGILVLVVVVGSIVALVLWRRGAPARSHARRPFALRGADLRSAEEMRAAAERAAAAGDWTLAVQERFRAVVRGLEQRTVIERRPGWTADEAARASGAALPGLAAALMGCARTFDEVTYGGHAADASAYATVADLDEQARHARAEPPQPPVAVPR